ncbi:MAG: hypothetical protein QG657_1095 [Acidobacteriota bacterium]|nr:hypothetical protein [Acidobacteriota bacterium]
MVKLKKILITSMVFLSILVTSFVMASCKSPTGEKQVNYVIHVEDEAEVEQLLNDTFRIDIKKIDVIFDYLPGTYTAECKATLSFVMRQGQGQRRPVIHLDPATRDKNTVRAIRLNNEPLDVFNEADVKILDYTNSTQSALEFQRDLAENIEHTLEIEYVLQLPQGYPRFSTEVNDLEGRGNEALFPTLNTPQEMSHHYFTFRVHGDREFRCIGSGLVERQNPDQEGLRQWTLDTERDVASFTVMFVLMPEEDTVFQTRRIGNVDVRIMAYQGGASIDSAFTQLESWIPQLITDFGLFPMPRGLSIFLTSTGGGMEYFGGTITSLWALEHEVFHMYFACSTINKTYRDLWMDEAINKWYSYSVDPAYRPIADDYRSNIVSGRSAVAVGFDRRAYEEGAQIIQSAAVRLGGRQEMIGFLSYLYRNYAFAPYTTIRFLDYLQEYSGVNMREDFQRWLYSDEQTTAAGAASTRYDRMIEQEKVDLTPPRSLLMKYGIRQ